MSAPKGNQFWKARSSHGRGKIFETPEILWDAACEYFQWVEDNPLYEEKAFHFQGQVIKEPIAKMRAMTISGLRLFLGISEQTLQVYEQREDFFGVIREIKETIYNQKFAGASADLLNANIIARDLGLTDKKDLSSTDGSMSPAGNTFDSSQYEKAQAKLRGKME
jgi:hypothetical protein